MSIEAQPGRRSGVPVAVYNRNNLTCRKATSLFGISDSAARRMVDDRAPLLAPASATGTHSRYTVLIVDGIMRRCWPWHV